MEFTIYSIGDAAFLYNVFIAISSFTNSGDFTVIGNIGLVLGLLIGGFQGISQGKGIAIAPVFVSFLVFTAMFGPTSRVLLQDAYSENVRVVDDVPVGVAFTGSVISTIGFVITRDFEQVFSTPNMTSKGFGAALEMIKRIRMNNLGRLGLGNFDSFPAGSAFNYNWGNYIKDCTTTKITLNPENREPMENASKKVGVLDSIKFESSIYHTKLTIPNIPTALRNCTEAFNDLKDYTKTTFLPEYKTKYLAGILGIKPEVVDFELAAGLRSVGMPEPESGMEIQDEFLLSTIIDGLYFQGWMQRHMDDRAYSYSTAVDDGIRQRQTQWMGQASLFREFVRPIMTFVEAFMFSVTPFMGFVIALGEFGLKLAAKYLYLLIWVQLWTPVMAVVNYFIHNGMRGQFENIELADVNVYSIGGMRHVDQTIIKYISTGEMMASSVPALTLFLLYGSSVAMTHMASRLNASDTFDEKKVSPDSYNAAPMMQQSANMQADPSQGIFKTNTPLLNSTMAWSRTNTEGVQSTQSALETSSKGFMSSWQEALQTGYQTSDKAEEQLSNTLQNSMSNSSQFSTIDSHMKNVSADYKGSDSWMQKAAVAASMGISVPSIFSALGISGGLAAKGELANAEQQVKSLASGITDQLQNNSQFASQVAVSTAQDQSQSVGLSTMVSESGSQTASLNDQASDVMSKSNAYQSTLQDAQSRNAQSQLNFVQAGAMINGTSGGTAAIIGLAEQYGVGGKMQEYKEMFKSDIADEGQRNATAALAALEFSGNTAAMNASNSIMSDVYYGSNSVSAGGGSSNSGLTGQGGFGVGGAVNHSNTSQLVNNGITVAENTISSARENASHPSQTLSSSASSRAQSQNDDYYSSRVGAMDQKQEATTAKINEEQNSLIKAGREQFNPPKEQTKQNNWNKPDSFQP